MPNYDRPPWWLASILSYPCERCGAEPGQRCTTKLGKPTEAPHAVRGHERRRCRHCQVILDADQDLGQVLCSRCALVRSLEVERSTTYKRQT